ncbi:hypothetical protein ACFLU6_06805 [Acidobacteriota bacterium]
MQRNGSVPKSDIDYIEQRSQHQRFFVFKALFAGHSLSGALD